MKQKPSPKQFKARPVKSSARAEVVCFGFVVPAYVITVDALPEYNTGGLIRQVDEFISDDAAIVACLLRGWSMATGLIGTTLGADARGRKVVRQLKRMGMLGDFRLSKSVTTPVEINISDRTGARTYFWQREPHLLDTLDTADLTLIAGARMLYADWYDGHHILRALQEANEQKVPVYLNIEYAHADPEILSGYARRATICQAVTDPAQRAGDVVSIAHKLLAAGVEIALVTMSRDGCLAAREGEMLYASAPSVDAVDGCGAGAAFSAAFIYAHLRGWEFEECVRFGVAAGSVKVTRLGLSDLHVEEIMQVARQVKVSGL